MRVWWACVAVAGCGVLTDGIVVADDPRALRCEAGQPVTIPTATESEARWAEGSEVRRCVDEEGVAHGKHVEVYDGNAVAVLGEWNTGQRTGTWLRWRVDGAFDGQAVWLDGTIQSERIVGSDGMVSELTYQDGVATSWATLSKATEMPEWNEGSQGTGVRHLEPLSSVADP